MCSVEGCGRESKTRGFCHKHYQQKRKEEREAGVSSMRSTVVGPCKADDCGKESAALGYCHKHYQRVKQHGDPNYQRPKKERPACAVDGCHVVEKCRGYCSTHYARWKAHGDPLKTLKPRKPKPSPMFETVFPVLDPMLSLHHMLAAAAEQLPGRLNKAGQSPVGQPVFAVLPGQAKPGVEGFPYVVVARVKTVPMPKRVYWRTDHD